MGWFRAHPYASVLCAACILIAFGVFIVNKRSPMPSTSNVVVWGGGGSALLNPAVSASSQGPQQNQGSILEQVVEGSPQIHPLPPASPVSAPGNQDSFDFNAFIATLSRRAPSSTPPSSSAPVTAGVSDAYAFIPTGLVSTTTSRQTRTAAQQALYEYGNAVGSFIQSFEGRYPDEVQTLKDQLADRGNPDKALAVVAIAAGLQEIGHNLSTTDNVPASAAGANAALAKSYMEIGTNLALVPKAKLDSDLIAAVETYDASADVFTKNYIALATLFGAYGVTFGPNDPGSAFTFTPLSL